MVWKFRLQGKEKMVRKLKVLFHSCAKFKKKNGPKINTHVSLVENTSLECNLRLARMRPASCSRVDLQRTHYFLIEHVK